MGKNRVKIVECPCLHELIKKFFFIIFGCTGSSLLCTSFLYLQTAETSFHCSEQASHRGAQALERRLNNCGTGA